MAQVFISYKHDDGDFALILNDRLDKAGFDGWLDDNLQAGEDWREMIDRAIRESMAVIVVLSPESVASEYVTYEWAFALGAGVPVVPVMLKRTPLHPRLEELQFLDFTNRRARPWALLIERLESLSEKRSGGNRSSKSSRPGPKWDALREQLGDKHADIRAEAARALGERREKAAVPVLARMLATDRSVRVRAAAAEALGWIGDEAAVPDLIAALDGAHRLVDPAARDALRRIGTKEARLAADSA